MQERSHTYRQPSSTPFIRKQMVRESLGRIKANTVSGMVNLFSQRKQLVINETSSEAELTPPRKNKAIITEQISFFNDLSSSNQALEYDSKSTSADSGYDSIGFRQRSSSCVSSSKANRPQNIIESYAKYPNFKWSYLKSFGEDPNEYLSRYGIDYETICDSSTGPKTIAGNNDVSNGCVKADDVEFNVMRKRSQSCNAKTLSELTNVRHRVDPNSKVREIPSLKEAAKCYQQENLSGGSIKQTHELNSASGGSNVVCRKRKRPLDGLPIAGVNDLRSRIQKSIDSYENNCKVRRLNPASFTNEE